jgi:hypothetical protein
VAAANDITIVNTPKALALLTLSLMNGDGCFRIFAQMRKTAP